MLRYNGNFIVAQKVLKEINKLIKVHPDKKEIEDRCYVECYSNGREQGFCIRSSELTIVFSECRNTDSIYICHGTGFSMQGNVPDEKSYRTNSMYINTVEYKQAAKYIIDLIVKIPNSIDFIMEGR